LNEILEALQSPDAGTRAEAVRTLCPCRTQWDIPVQRYITPLRDDPSSSVRHEVHHVLDEDSGWGRRIKNREPYEGIDEDAAAGEYHGPHSIAWFQRPKWRARGRFKPRRRRR
jgi:hypothetical protein